MNESTELKNKPLISSWQFKFFAGSVALLVVVILKVSNLLSFDIFSKIFGSAMVNVISPIAAGAVTVKNAILEFSGLPFSAIDWITYSSAFVSLCATFVFGPTMYIVLQRKIQTQISEQKKASVAVRIIFGVTVAWCVLLPAVIFPTYVASHSIFETMKSDNDLSRYRGEVVDQLGAISYKAQQYFVIPAAEGGGGNSFVKGKGTIILKDIGFQERTLLGRFVLYKGDTDTTLKILFVGTKIVPKETWEQDNIDSIVEYETAINPSSHRISKIR